MQTLDIIHDQRSNCTSLMHTSTVSNYLSLVGEVYHARGQIEGQRSPLRTKTAKRIRKQMVDDLKAGALLPPIVIGATLTADQIDEVSKLTDRGSLETFITSINSDYVSIIDGMQRTTALLDANVDNSINDNPVRIEFWFTSDTNSLIYRMLVLNTGQIPWDIKRQLETVYTAILADIKKAVGNIEILSVDDSTRRSKAGQFRSGNLIQYFLAFSSRKVHIDIKEQVAADFARLDVTEATGSINFLSAYVEVVRLLVLLDEVFSKFRDLQEEVSGERFKIGRDVFTSAPAGIGFMAAAAVTTYGAAGFPMSGDHEARIRQVSKNVNELVEKLDALDEQQLGEFLQLMELNERLSIKTSKVGEFEREFFFRAFRALFEHGKALPSLTPCWTA